MPYIGNQPGTGVRNRFIYTATASQTTFSGADDNGKTLKYADSDFVDVFLNGVCLVPSVDYTSTTKTSVVLTQAASLNDTLEVIAYDIATIADTVSKADGGTFEANVTFADGADILTASKGTDNVRLGENAGAAIASGGNNNVAIGKNALASNTTADNSTAVGFEAGTNSTGAQNTFFGRQSGKGVTSGTESVFVGNGAGRDGTQTGDYNIGIGSVSLNALTSGHSNTAIGRDALGANTTASNNTAVGYQAGSTLSTGGANVFIGQAAGLNTIGTNNTFLGVNSGDLVTSGNKNTILGRFNGNQSGHDIRTSDNQIVLSDGDGNPRFMFHSFWQTDGHAISTIQTDLTLNNGATTDVSVPHGTYLLTLKMIIAGTGQATSTYTAASWYHSSTAYMDIIQLGTDGAGLTASAATGSSGNMTVRVANNTGYSGHTIKFAMLRTE